MHDPDNTGWNPIAIAALLLALAAPVQAQDFYGTVNTGFRAKSQGATVGWTPLRLGTARLGVEASFYQFGVQPSPHKNLNRAAGLSLVAVVPADDKWAFYGHVGKQSTYYSFNGNNDYRRTNDNTWGAVAGFGVQYSINPSVYVQLGISTFEYQEIDIDRRGGYGHGHVSVGVRF